MMKNERRLPNVPVVVFAGQSAYLRTRRDHHQCKGKDEFIKEVMEGKLPVTEEVAKAFLRCTTCMKLHDQLPFGRRSRERSRPPKQMVDAGHDNLFKAMGEVVKKSGNIYGESGRHDWGHKERPGADRPLPGLRRVRQRPRSPGRGRSAPGPLYGPISGARSRHRCCQTCRPLSPSP